MGSHPLAEGTVTAFTDVAKSAFWLHWSTRNLWVDSGALDSPRIFPLCCRVSLGAFRDSGARFERRAAISCYGLAEWLSLRSNSFDGASMLR
jgi:hypothetical protein